MYNSRIVEYIFVNMFFMFSLWNYPVSLGICRGLVSESNMVAKFHKCSSPSCKMNLRVWMENWLLLESIRFLKLYTFFSILTNKSPMRMRIIALTYINLIMWHKVPIMNLINYYLMLLINISTALSRGDSPNILGNDRSQRPGD